MTDTQVEAPIKCVPNPGVTSQVHTIPISGLCPVTSNPLEGSKISVAYMPDKSCLELYSLATFVHSFRESKTAMDLEQFIVQVAQACANVLQLDVTYTGKFDVSLGENRTSHMAVTGTARPTKPTI